MEEHELVKARTRALVREGAAAGAGLAEQGGLNATDRRALRLLDALAGEDPLTPGRLAHEIGLSPAATTALVDRLADAGLIERVRDLPDRRQVRLVLTAAARRFGREVLAPLERRIDTAAARLDPAQAAVVAAFLADTLTPDGDGDGDGADDVSGGGGG